MARDLDYRPMSARPLAGWIAGCVAASVAIAIFGAISAAVSSGSFMTLTAVLIIFLSGTPLILFVVGALTAIPALMVIWVTELFGVRSVLFFGCSGEVVGGLCQVLLWRALAHQASLSPVFVAAGFVGGWAYWFVAGKYARGDYYWFWKPT
jgi:hypothetical protein